MTKKIDLMPYEFVIKRLFAKGVDFLLIVLVSVLIPFLGPLISCVYSLIADGVFDGQSVGKKFFNIKVVDSKTGGSISYRESVIRNTPVGAVTLLSLIPVWGWIIFIIVGIPLMGIEVYLIFKAEKSQRLGDVMASTEVHSI